MKQYRKLYIIFIIIYTKISVALLFSVVFLLPFFVHSLNIKIRFCYGETFLRNIRTLFSIKQQKDDERKKEQ